MSDILEKYKAEYIKASDEPENMREVFFYDDHPFWVELETRVRTLEDEVKKWEAWADKSGIIWRKEDVERFNKIDRTPPTEEEKKNLRECWETFLRMKPSRLEFHVHRRQRRVQEVWS